MSSKSHWKWENFQKIICFSKKFIKMNSSLHFKLNFLDTFCINCRSYICHHETAFRFPNFPVVFDLEPKNHFSPALLKLLYWPTTTAE